MNPDLIPLKDLSKELSKEEYQKQYLKASNIFLQKECYTSIKDMENILSNQKYIINRQTGRPHTQYKYRMDLSGNSQNIELKTDDGKLVKFNKSKLLQNKENKKKIFDYYKKLNSYINIYQDKYKEDIWWMTFSL